MATRRKIEVEDEGGSRKQRRVEDDTISEAGLYMVQYFLWSEQYKTWEDYQRLNKQVMDYITKLGGAQSPQVIRFETHSGANAKKKFAYHTWRVFADRFRFQALLDEIHTHGSAERIFVDMCEYEEELERKQIAESQRDSEKHKKELDELRALVVISTQMVQSVETEEQ